MQFPGELGALGFAQGVDVGRQFLQALARMLEFALVAEALADVEADADHGGPPADLDAGAIDFHRDGAAVAVQEFDP